MHDYARAQTHENTHLRNSLQTLTRTAVKHATAFPEPFVMLCSSAMPTHCPRPSTGHRDASR
eukprot:6115772-Lingulodinium_polyedra.AAC.1